MVCVNLFFFFLICQWQKPRSQSAFTYACCTCVPGTWTSCTTVQWQSLTSGKGHHAREAGSTRHMVFLYRGGLERAPETVRLAPKMEGRSKCYIFPGWEEKEKLDKGLVKLETCWALVQACDGSFFPTKNGKVKTLFTDRNILFRQISDQWTP